MVSKVNSALRSSEALAARKLQSRDIVVSFKNSTEAHAKDNAWVKAAYSDQAAIAKRTYVVLAKGIPRSLMERRAEEEIKADLKKVNKVAVARYRRRIPKSNKAGYNLMLIKVKAVATV